MGIEDPRKRLKPLKRRKDTLARYLFIGAIASLTAFPGIDATAGRVSCAKCQFHVFSAFLLTIPATQGIEFHTSMSFLCRKQLPDERNMAEREVGVVKVLVS